MSDGILRRAHKPNCNLFKDGREGGGNCDCVEDLQYHNKPQLAPGFGPATINKSGYDQLAPGFGPAPPKPEPLVQPGYEPLARALQAALDQSQLGKGRERHATTGKPFTSQPICEIGRMVGIGYNVGQAMKKGQEAIRLPADRAQAELLGAIVYLASAYVLLGEFKEV